MDVENMMLLPSDNHFNSKPGAPIFLMLILWSMGIIDWSPPNYGRGQDIFLCPVVGSFRLRRRPVFLFSMFFVITMGFTSYFGAITYFMCYAGYKERLFRFVFVVVCYWPPLMSGSVFIVLAFVKNKCRKSKNDKVKVSWITLFQESTFLKRLSFLGNFRMFRLPKPGIFVFFNFCGVIVSCVVVLFYIEIYHSCLTWLSYMWMASELIGLTFLANFCYFLYLQRVILEEEYEETESFIETHAGQLVNCTGKVSEFFCNYFQLRQLFLFWLSIIFFSITFGVAGYFTWSNKEFSEPANFTASPTYFPLHTEGMKKACPYSCDDPRYLENQFHLHIFNVLAVAKLSVPAIFSFSVTRGLDIKYMWNRLILRLRLMSATEDSDFWYRLIKYTENLHPKTTMGKKVTLIFPIIGLFFGFLGCWKNMKELK